MMNRLINRLVTLTAFLAVVVNVSCSKNTAPEPLPGVGNGEIRLSAVVTDAINTKAAGGTVVDGADGAKAVLDGIHFLKKEGAEPQTNFSGVTAVSGNRDITGAIVFAAPPTYSKSDENAWFAAYWPSSSGVGSAIVAVTPGEKVVWEAMVSTDILLSTQSYDAGKYSAPKTGTMTFKHAMARLEVIVKAVPTTTASLVAVQNCWGNINWIGTLNTAKKMTYTYATNAVTYDNFSGMYLFKSDYSGHIEGLSIPSNTSTAVNAKGMFPPLTGGLLRMKIFSNQFENGVEVPVQLKNAEGVNCDFEAGKCYTVTLTFGADSKNIGVKTTISAWTTGYTAESNPEWSPKPRVEDYYYTDGTFSRDLKSDKTVEGVICWVDSANPSHFKIVSIDEPPANYDGGTNAAGCLPWGNLQESSGATITSDGKTNTLTLMQRANAADYKAAKWCFDKNTGLSTSVTTSDAAYKWYLPMKDEMQHIFCAYWGVAPREWSDNSPFSAASGYPEAWNARFTTQFASAFYWSSTESSGNYSLSVNFTTGHTNTTNGSLKNDTSCRVRCVREIL